MNTQQLVWVTPAQKYQTCKAVTREWFFHSSKQNKSLKKIFSSILHRHTCLTVLLERGCVEFSNYPCCCELVLSVHPSLTCIEVCNLFPSCVIQCGATLCSPEEHKQLPAPLIHTGALNSFYARHLTRILRRRIIYVYLPEARLISLAAFLS